MTSKSAAATQKKQETQQNSSTRNNGAAAVKPKKKGIKRKILWKVTKMVIRHSVYHAIGMPHLSFMELAGHLLN